MNTLALIPARKGSKGVSKKNVQSLGGHPLIAYSITAALMSEAIDRVIVSTDCEEIAEIAKKYGAEVPFLRPSELAEDTSPDRDFILHAINWLKGQTPEIPEFIVHLRPTTPLRDPEVIDEAIRFLRSTPEASALRSAHPASESPFKWFTIDEANYYSPIVSHMTVEGTNAPRQTFPSVYIPNGYVDVLRTSLVLNSDSIHGNKILSFVSPVGHEIDTWEDFERLEFESVRKPWRVRDYLNKRNV